MKTENDIDPDYPNPATKTKKAAVKKATKRKVKEENADDEVVKKKVKTEVGVSAAVKTVKSEKERNEKQKAKKEVKKELAGASKGSTTDVSWTVEEVIQGSLDVPGWAAGNVVKLLDEGCTIPFIARYRKEQTGGMEVHKLRDTLTMVEELRNVITKVKQAKTTISEQGKLTPELESALSSAQTLPEVDCLFAAFKPGSKGTLAERARTLGLEPLAIKFLKCTGRIQDANSYIDADTKGLGSVTQVMEGVQHILADMIHKDTAVMEKIRALSSHYAIEIHCTQAKAKKAAEPKPGVKVEPAHKYQLYFSFNSTIGRMQPHQVLAINRGESHKILSVKVVVPDYLKEQMMRLCERKWLPRHAGNDVMKVIKDSIDDAYSRLIQPQIVRAARSQLTKNAEKSSIDVFATNLKNLLLSAPLKGDTILAIDPGFTNGCKIAVISPTGGILSTDVIFIHSHKSNKLKEKQKFEDLVRDNNCDVVAIGNGSACRETETVVADSIQKAFPKLKYCIVDECGASIYSVSDIAQKEMPDLDPTLRGAVSIGRRLLDPLAEFVKYDPKHLGVGQYQHDMPQSQLKTSLDATVEECVSFVGVDVNTCSQCLLSRVSGLSAARAKNIMEWREKFGPFICREQLLSVKGLGAKSYEQAAGFVRIHSLNKGSSADSKLSSKSAKGTTTGVKKGAGGKGSKSKKGCHDYLLNPLDMTWIHPESYDLTQRFIDLVGADVSCLGQAQFVQQIQKYTKKNSIKQVSGELQCGEDTLTLIRDALLRPLTYDLREEFDKPLFKSSIKTMGNLRTGEKVTGRVTNVTHFGAFVDIGVEQNGLVHVSQMRLSGGTKHQLQIGENIEAIILNVEVDRKRIGLKLHQILQKKS